MITAKTKIINAIDKQTIKIISHMSKSLSSLLELVVMLKFVVEEKLLIDKFTDEDVTNDDEEVVITLTIRPFMVTFCIVNGAFDLLLWASKIGCIISFRVTFVELNNASISATTLPFKNLLNRKEIKPGRFS